MIFSHRQLLAALVLLSTSDAFQLSTNKLNGVVLRSSPCPSGSASTTACFNLINDNNEEPERKPRGGLRKFVSKLKKPVAFLTLVASSAALVGAPQAADASAPVMAMPKADVRDPGLDALENHQRKMQVEAQDELRKFNARARQIEAKEGGAARVKFEQEYKKDQERMAQERLDKIQKLKIDLLGQGICPFIDIEGQRQLLAVEKGVDLGEIAGTTFHLEKEFEKRNPQASYAYKKQANRAIVKCMFEDMKNRDIDPVEYFKTHQDKTTAILDLPAAQAASLATKYRQNLEVYGQIAPPKEGEMSAKEKMAKKGGSSAIKDEAKRLKAEAKAKAAAEKAETKAKAAAEKAKAKEEKERAKAEAKAAKEAAKEDAKASKAAAAAAAAAGVAAASNSAAASMVSAAADVVEGTTETIESFHAGDESSSAAVTAPTKSDSSVAKKKSKGIPIVPASAVLVAVGGGGYALKMLRDKAAADEEERQRQFQLLMGGLDDEKASPSSAPALEEVDMSDMVFDDEKTRESIEEEKPAVASPKKKKKRGMKMFGKKKNSREIDINALVSADAKSPDFAKLLAKILTFGAPGRFPDVLALPGAMPMQEFKFEAASEMLAEAQKSAGLSKEDAAEVFANVVNCMLIDMVDLASTSLGEKDNKILVNAVGIVVDFMNHAASLYNSIAEGVVIVPVTYGGDLSKGKLEQMYSAFAVSGMTNFASMDEDFDNKVSLLQDVFQINEKKAEGLMMKAMQTNMMEMMKSGEGMEGMEEMMKGMEGMEGMMGGLPGMGDGEEPSPEQLKEMLYALKELKESGSIPDSELQEVKKQFKDAFGSSIDDVMKDADASEGELGSQDKELLDLMKSILDD